MVHAAVLACLLRYAVSQVVRVIVGNSSARQSSNPSFEYVVFGCSTRFAKLGAHVNSAGSAVLFFSGVLRRVAEPTLTPRHTANLHSPLLASISKMHSDRSYVCMCTLCDASLLLFCNSCGTTSLLSNECSRERRYLQHRRKRSSLDSGPPTFFAKCRVAERELNFSFFRGTGICRTSQDVEYNVYDRFSEYR